MNLKILSLLLGLSALTTFGQSPTEKMLNDVAAAQKAKSIKSSGTEFIDGRIILNITEIRYYYPIKKGRRRCEQTKTTISTSFYGRIMQGRIKLYMARPAERLKCEAGTHCPVFEGSSKYVLKRDPATMKITETKEYPLQISTESMEQDFKWVKEKEQYVVTAKSSASGTNDLEGLTIEIKPYKPASNNNEVVLAPLVPQYVIWLTGGRTLSRLTENPAGNGNALRWDDAREKLVPDNAPPSIGIPYDLNSPERAEREGENIYTQLLITDVKAFDNYLLNPKGSFSISATAQRYTNSDYMESKKTIAATISFSPDISLAPLEPVNDDPVLTPLKPVTDELPLR